MPLALVKYGLTRRHVGLAHFAWKADLGKTYDIVIIGAGGHGLAAAYYLATRHGIGKVAVLGKGVLSGESHAEHVAIPFGDPCPPSHDALERESVGLFRALSHELGMNIMYSERGRIDLVHDEASIGSARWRVEVAKHEGAPAEFLSPDGIRKICPALELAPPSHRLVLGAVYDPRGAIASRDALSWAYAREAMRHGVDIHMRAGDTRILVQGDRAIGVETGRGKIHAGMVLETGPSIPPLLAKSIGHEIGLRPSAWQVCYSEAVKPSFDQIVVSDALRVSIYQSPEGELIFGHVPETSSSGLPSSPFDLQTSLAWRVLELFPFMGELRVLRRFTGHADVTADGAPVMGPGPIRNYYLDAGWGAGGLMAAPASGLHMAACLATGQVTNSLKPLGLDRFLALDPVPLAVRPPGVIHNARGTA